MAGSISCGAYSLPRRSTDRCLPSGSYRSIGAGMDHIGTEEGMDQLAESLIALERLAWTVVGLAIAGIIVLMWRKIRHL